jgi:uncharacterized protein YgiM (DUF1202 family)
VDTVTVVRADPAVERQLAEAQLRILEQQALIADLQRHLDEAERELLRSLAKIQTSATRAEAASAMAEAELALGSLRQANGPAAEVSRAEERLRGSQEEFGRLNFGGAVYLANQVKALAAQRGQLGVGDADARPDEIAFTVPLRLASTARSNVRDGPGTTFRVLFTLEPGASLTARSHASGWLRVADETGRAGWIHQGLVTSRQ